MEHQQQMIQQLLEAQTQAQAQALANQQAQQENQLKAQQDMQTALLQCVSSNGDQGRSQLRDTERRVEGLSMPAYHGHLNESIGLYIHRVKTFFAAKNLKYETDETVEARLHDIKCLNIRTLELMMNLPSRGEEVDVSNVEVEVPHQLVINHAEKFSYSSIKMDDNLKQRFVRAYAKTKEFENEDKFEKKDGLFFVKSKDQVWKLCVPNDDYLKGEIISQSHDTSTTAHPGVLSVWAEGMLEWFLP
ncbi:hypothetical protein DYB35_008933 [Aphanomyces astaci]|uniref:Integrase zinc-binding domain-containing protein n=2 Tax=Aphanomyces astaci TaxID=112090 RepID=A0A418CKE9_APHAT|nr:hypothetical protein DYB35_008933 [Aphanomyces astaci]